MIVLALASLFAVQAPPARFDYPAKNVRVIEKSANDVHSFCSQAARVSGRIIACAFPLQGRCYIVWPKGIPRSGVIWRHENAHCNGWPAHHPR